MDWTNGQTAVLASLVLAFILTFLGDVYTTAVGLQNGFVEANPVQNFLFKHFSQSFSAFISGIGALAIGSAIAAHSLGAGYLFFGILAAGESVRTVLNYLKLKKAKRV